MTKFPNNPLLKGKIMKSGFFAACVLAVSAVGAIAPVSYTHLTLPTIYSV